MHETPSPGAVEMIDAVGMPDDLQGFAESLAPGQWPTADVNALRECARRCRELADALAAVGSDIVDAHRGIGGAGALHDALGVGVDRLAGGEESTTLTAVARAHALADIVDRYADAAESAQGEMSVVAAIADRDRLRADLMADLGDDSARVVAAVGGRMAMTAAGDEYTDAAGNVDTTHHHDDGQPPPAATSGMMPFAAMGGLAAAGAGLGAAFHHGGGDSGGATLAQSDINWLQRRAEQLQAALGPSVSPWVRMAVGIGIADNGARTIVVGAGDVPAPYLYAGIDHVPGEVVAGNGGSAEMAVANTIAAQGMRVEAVAAATPMSAAAEEALSDMGAAVFAPQFQDAGDLHWVSGDHVTDHQ